MSPEDKARVKAAKNDFNLHVALIMRGEASKPDAAILAYSEGKAGLNARLNPAGKP